MMYLLWALLNLALFIFFVRICITATRLINEKIGLLTSVVFVVGLLFMGCSNTEKTTQDRTWTFTSQDSLDNNSGYLIQVLLENNFIAKCYLNIGCEKDKQQNKFPANAFSPVFGIICGTNWKPANITVEKINNDKFYYNVAGVLEWKLLGATIYSQFKYYDGIAYTDINKARIKNSSFL
ncbi:MAG: hypothetical protein ABJB05_08895 [Parafilimonas sp.]